MLLRRSSEPGAGGTARLLAVAATCALLVMAFADRVLPVRQAADITPQGPEQSPAEVWAENMARLGIRPVYPPTEDVHVGDIWIFPVPKDDDPAAGALEPLLTRGVRIGHAGPLRAEIMASVNRGPVFGDQRPRAEDRARGHELRLEIAEARQPDRVALALVGFPNLSRQQTQQVSGGATGFLAGIRGSAQQTFIEEISVPQAVGYGVDAQAASLALLVWCAENSQQCARPRLAQVLRMAHGPKAVPPDADIGLLLIHYVFATQEIQFRRIRLDDRSGSLDARTGAGGATDPSLNIEARNGNSREVTASRVFERPVVIGFRGVSILAP